MSNNTETPDYTLDNLTFLPIEQMIQPPMVFVVYNTGTGATGPAGKSEWADISSKLDLNEFKQV
jgi:hypothetical protein